MKKDSKQRYAQRMGLIKFMENEIKEKEKNEEEINKEDVNLIKKLKLLNTGKHKYRLGKK